MKKKLLSLLCLMLVAIGASAFTTSINFTARPSYFASAGEASRGDLTYAYFVDGTITRDYVIEQLTDGNKGILNSAVAQSTYTPGGSGAFAHADYSITNNQYYTAFMVVLNSSTVDGATKFIVTNTLTSSRTIRPAQVIGEYYNFSWSEDDKTISWTNFPAPAVCKIGGAEYSSVQEAIAAVTEGQTIQLTADINITSTISVESTTPAFTLDLNGHVMKQTGSNCSVISNSGNLTIVDNYTGKAPTHTIGTKTFTGGIITGGNGNYGGAIHNKGTIEVSGGTITGNSASYGGAIYNYKGTLTLKGGTFTGNSATQFGGAIYNYSGTLTVSGGTITENTATSYGGAIYNQGTLEISGGAFTENSAKFGGAIYNYSGTLTVSGGTITENTATSYGGAIENFGILSLGDGTIIKNNTSKGNHLSGGVYSCYYSSNFPGTVSISGKVIITDNTTTLNGQGNALKANLCFSGVNKSGNPFTPMTISNLKEGTSIGITTENNDVEGAYQFTSNGAESDLQYFTADNAAFKKVYTGNYLELVLPLSETATAAPTLYNGNVEMTRTLKANQWNTLCLPYSMTADEITSAKLGTVMKMTGIENNVVNFADATEIEAGEMYIVKPTEAVTSFSVSGKTPATPEAKAFGTDWTVNAPMYQSTISQEEGNTKYVLSNDKFYTVDQQNLAVKGFRWYITDTTGSQAKVGLSISFDGDVATAISNVNANVDANNNGKFLQNGKLVIVKDGKTYNAAGQLVK